MSEEWDDVQAELNRGSGQFYRPNALVVGESEDIEIVRYAKWTDTKYPIKDKEGNSLGYTWRFFLKDGRAWDVSNANRMTLLRGLHPDNGKVSVPAQFRITNLGQSVNKKPAQKVEFLSSVTP